MFSRPTGRYYCCGLVLILQTVVLTLTGCSSATPTAPRGSIQGGPQSTERRVGAVGGGDDVCVEPNPCPPPPAGEFTLTAANGDTLTGTPDDPSFQWEITGGTGRFQNSQGLAILEPTADSINTAFFFIPPQPSPSASAEGVLTFTGSTSQASTLCTSGTMITRTYSGTLESFGRVTLTVSTCGT